MNKLCYSKERDLLMIADEINKANLVMTPSYKFEYLGWEFHRVHNRWEVETISSGLSFEDGMELYNAPFPYQMFDDPRSKNYGQYIRLAGHKGALSPEDNGRIWLNNNTCCKYHIDNQCAFNFFVNFLKEKIIDKR